MISTVASIISLAVSIYAISVAKALQSKTLASTAADRALQRFNRINELLLKDPKLNRVFKDRFTTLKSDPEAKVFIWYLFNQLEGTYLDSLLGILKKEYFQSYDKWLGDILKREAALADFLSQPDAEDRVRPYFSASYWDYLQGKLPKERVQKEAAAGSGS